jgi:hypothetical protein
MSRSFRGAHAAGAVLLATALVACGSSSTAPGPRHAVSLQVSPLSASHSSSTAAVPAGLELTGVRLSIGQTSLGSGEQFGCQDCQNEEAESAQSDGAPSIVAIPATGGPVLLAVEQVSAGTYPEAQIDLVKPVTPAFGGVADNTIEITGKYNGTSFTVAFPILGTFHQLLTPPVTVTGTANAPISATVTLPVASWFTGSNGVALDPGNPAQLAQIQANARSYFSVDAGERPE